MRLVSSRLCRQGWHPPVCRINRWRISAVNRWWYARQNAQKRPAQRASWVREIVEVQLPRPRVYEMQDTPEFIELKRHVHGLIHDEAVKATGLGAVLARSAES